MGAARSCAWAYRAGSEAWNVTPARSPSAIDARVHRHSRHAAAGYVKSHASLQLLRPWRHNGYLHKSQEFRLRSGLQVIHTALHTNTTPALHLALMGSNHRAAAFSTCFCGPRLQQKSLTFATTPWLNGHECSGTSLRYGTRSRNDASYVVWLVSARWR
jgi:hypothetical protein